MLFRKKSLLALSLAGVLMSQSVMPVYASEPTGAPAQFAQIDDAAPGSGENEPASDPAGSGESEPASDPAGSGGEGTGSENGATGETDPAGEQNGTGDETPGSGVGTADTANGENGDVVGDSDEADDEDPDLESDAEDEDDEDPDDFESDEDKDALGNGGYISDISGDYYVNHGTVVLNGHTDVENYTSDSAKLHTAVYEDQIYEYHGGRVFIGNEVILPGNMLPSDAAVTATPADPDGKDASGDAVATVAHNGLSFTGSTSYVYSLTDIPAEVCDSFSVKDYESGYLYDEPALLDNIEFYAWEYEKNSSGEYTRKSITRISDSDITWDDSVYVPYDGSTHVTPYVLPGSVKIKPSSSNPIAIVAYVYDCWAGDGSAYVRDHDDNAAAIGFIEYSGGHSSFSIFEGSGDYGTREPGYLSVRHRADHFTDGFSLFPYYYHKLDGRLTLYGYDSLLGQFMSGYNDLTVDDYYLDTLRIPATWTDPETGDRYDVAIGAISDGARSIDPGYAGTIIISDGVAFPADCSELFGLGSFYLQNFIIEGADGSVGSNITDMSDMFSYGHTIYSTPLDTVDVTALDTSNVTDMSHMFEGVEVSSLDVSLFNVSHVTDFSYMFYDCDATSLDVSGWNTSSAVDMSHMFEGEGQFNNTLKGGKLNKGVAAMGQLRGSLDLSGFDFSHVTDMSNMFANQGYITSIKFPYSIDTSHVTNMRYMFASCSSLTEITNIERFNTSSVTDMGGMFGAWNVRPFIETREYDYLGPWHWELLGRSKDEDADTYSGTKSRNDGPALTSLDLSNWDTSKVINMAGMFSMPELTSLTVGWNFDTSKVRDFSGAFVFRKMENADFLWRVDIKEARLAYNMVDMPLPTYFRFSSVDLSHISDTTYYYCNFSINMPQVQTMDLSGAVFGSAAGAFREDTFSGMTGMSTLMLPANMPQFTEPPVMPVTFYDDAGWEYPTLPGGNERALTLTSSEDNLRDVRMRAITTYNGESVEYVPDTTTETVHLYHWGRGEYNEDEYQTFRDDYPESVMLELVYDPEYPVPDPVVKWEVISQTPDGGYGSVIDVSYFTDCTSRSVDLYHSFRYTTGSALVRATVNGEIVMDCSVVVTNSPYTTSGSDGSQMTLTCGSDRHDYLCRLLSDGTVSVLKLKSSGATTVDLRGGVGGYTVSEIGGYAFDNSGSLTSVRLPASVKKIGSHAFSCCGSLETFTAPGLQEIGDYAFVSDYNLYKDQAFPIASTVTSVRDYAFRYCPFSSIDLSNAVSIGHSIFDGCSNLTSFTYDDTKLEYWGDDNILYGSELAATQLTEFSVPSCITQIGALDRNYYGSPFPQTLERLYFGANVTTIGNYGLKGMKALRRLNSDTDGVAVIPDTVTSVGEGAFAEWDCDIHELTLPATITSVGAEAFMDGGKSEGKGLYNVTILGTFDTIPYRMFKDNKSIQTVSIANLAEGAAIGNEAFYKCTALTSLTIDDEVTSVGMDAFHGSTKLESINAGGGRQVNFLTKATKIGVRAFDGCESLAFGAFTLPATVSVGDNAFDLCKGLTSIAMPAVVSIDDHAFWGCENLTQMSFSTDLETLGSQMIEKTGVTGIDLSMATGLTEIPDYCLGVYNTNLGITSELTTVILPPNIERIGHWAFARTTKLKEITLPDGLISIDTAAFTGSGLTSITIPDSVRIISGADPDADLDFAAASNETGAFEGCTSLATVTFGSGLEVLGNRAFSSCSSLSKVDMSGTAVRVIGSNAFYRSSYYPITELRLSDATQSIGYGAFNSLSNGITSMRLPSSLKEMGCHEGIDWAYPVFGTTFDRLILPLGMKKVGTVSFNGNSYNGGNTVLIEIPYTVTNIDGLKCNGIMKKTFDQGEIESNGGKEYLGLIVYGGTETEWNRLVDTYNLTQSYPQDWSKFHILFNAGWTRGANGIPKYVPYDFSKFYPTYTAGENYDPADDPDLTRPVGGPVKMNGAYYFFDTSGSLMKDTAIIWNGKVSERYEITDTEAYGYDAAKVYGNFYLSKLASADLYYFDAAGTGTLVKHFETAATPTLDSLDTSSITDGIYTQPNDPEARFIVSGRTLAKGSTSTVIPSELRIWQQSIYHPCRNGKLTLGYTESPSITEDGKEVRYGWYFDDTLTANAGKLVWYSKTVDGVTKYYRPVPGAALIDEALVATDDYLLDGNYPDEAGQSVHFTAGSPMGLTGVRLYGAATAEEAAAIDVTTAAEAERVDLVIPDGEDHADYVLRLVTEPAAPKPAPGISWAVLTNAPKTAGAQVLQITQDPEDSHLLHVKAANPGRSRIRITAKAMDTDSNTIGTYEAECLFVVADTRVYPTGLTITSVGGSRTVGMSGSLTLQATYTPDGANASTAVTWRSSNSGIATVTADTNDSSKAVVRGINPGNAVIQAVTDNHVRASIQITVGQPVRVTGVSLNRTGATLYAGSGTEESDRTIMLTATVKPDNASNKEVTWISSEPSVATVDDSGLVTAVGPGTAVITATATDESGKYARCTITVYRAVEVTFDANAGGDAVTLTPASKTVICGEEYGELPVPVRTYHDFDGWYLRETTGDVKVTARTVMTAEDDHVLYAGWIPYNGWKKDGDIWKYFDNARYLTNTFLQLGASSYYLTGDGSRAVGRQEITVTNPGTGAATTGWYYFNRKGVMQTGWVSDGAGKHYYDPAGGAMVTGAWIGDGKGRVYVDENGDRMSAGPAAITETMTVDDGNGHVTEEPVEHEYYFDNNGQVRTGWIKITDHWYYYNPSEDNYGARITAPDDGNNNTNNTMRIIIAGKTYLIDETGERLTGWTDPYDYINEAGDPQSGFLCYYDTNGTLVTGWKKIDGAWYYFYPNETADPDDPNLVRARGTKARSGMVVVDGKLYLFGPDGVRAGAGEEAGSGSSGTIGTTGRNGVVKVEEAGFVSTSDGSEVYVNENGKIAKNTWIQETVSVPDGNGGTVQETRDIRIGADGKRQTGVAKVDGKLYVFSAGVADTSSADYAYNSDGSVQTGWFEKNGNTHYCDDAGNILKETTCKIGNKVYGFTAAGELMTAGRYTRSETDDGNGNTVVTYVKVGESSAEYTAEQISAAEYIVRDDGTLYTGWNGDYYFSATTGEKCTGLGKVGTKWYYFDASGAVQTTTGFVSTPAVSNKYYINEKGNVQTGWKTITDPDTGVASKYYFDKTGLRNDGVITVGIRKYYQTAKGIITSGTANVESDTVKFKAVCRDAGGVTVFDVRDTQFPDVPHIIAATFTGALKSGWLTVTDPGTGTESTYYFDPTTGAAYTGYHVIGGRWYEFGADGKLKNQN